MNKKQKLFVISGAMAVLFTSGLWGYYLYAKKDRDDDVSVQLSPFALVPMPTTTTSQPKNPSDPVLPVPTPAPAPAPTPPPPPTPVYTYRNGTYTATVSYSVPNGGTNTITTTLTVSNDKVSAVSATHNANVSSKSLSYINPFEQQVCGVVCGKSLAGLSPGTIAGASLTTAAFRSTLNSVRVAAKA